MSPIAVAVIAVAMSVDSGIACIGRGAGESRPTFRDALVTGLVFGFVEALTPVIGWAGGLAARSYIAAVDHWIAFGLLGLVGAHMVLHAVRGSKGLPAAQPTSTPVMLLATAVGTSIDAMAVGVSLAFLQADIVAVALAVGTTTFIFSIGGLMIGRFIGQRFSTWAEFYGGVALSLLGLLILLDHLLA